MKVYFLAIFLCICVFPAYSLEFLSVKVGESPWAISINPSTNKIYVTNFGNDSVSVIDGKTDTVIRNITVGENPDGVSIDYTKNIIYVANSGDGTVSVISDNKVHQTIPSGTNPYGIAVNPSTGKIYAGNDSPGMVYIISDSKADQDFFESITNFFLHLFHLK